MGKTADSRATGARPDPVRTSIVGRRNTATSRAKEAVEEAAEETRVAGRARGYLAASCRITEKVRPAPGGGRRGAACPCLTGPHGRAGRPVTGTLPGEQEERGGMRGASGGSVEATGGLLGAKPGLLTDQAALVWLTTMVLIKWGKCSSA